MAKLTEEQVRHVAKLANLPVTDEEVHKYSEQLSVILEYVEQLNQIDTTGVEPTFNVSGQINVFQKDNPVAGLSQEQALKNAKDTRDGMFVVKRVIGGE